MTATEMAKLFLASMNQTNNYQISSAEVSQWLTTAQNAIFNEYYGNLKEKKDARAPLPISFQSSTMMDDVLYPFTRIVTITTNPFGFFPYPPDFCQFASLSAKLPAGKKCVRDYGDGYVSVRRMNENEFGATVQNSLYKPTWENAKYPVDNYRPSYYRRDTGIQMVPENITYTLRFAYVVFPSAIAVANGPGTPFEWEYINYFGNPQFVFVPNDTDTLFPVNKHQEIVYRAVQLFSKSLPDYAQSQAESAEINKGV